MPKDSSSSSQPDTAGSFREDWSFFWRQIPFKGAFFGLLAGWIVLFQFLGNSTLGYIDTPSLFGWLIYCYENSVDDQHGYLIPFVVLALLWWKRESLMAVPKQPWWPGLLLFGLAALIHVAGYVVQQTRLSAIGFFTGIYALMGMLWGYKWLKATFFPFFLFAFCVPLATLSEPITFPLRLLATKITSFFSHQGLGIPVVCDGTRIFDPDGRYKYEVAAACSGIRSLTATVAFSLIYGFMMFAGFWPRLLMVAAAFPLAVAANVFRLSMIILASEAFGGQAAGNYVHESSWLSLLPYIPSILGVFLLGHCLQKWVRSKPNDDNTGATAHSLVQPPAQQKA